jgi:hypothetical protein
VTVCLGGPYATQANEAQPSTIELIRKAAGNNAIEEIVFSTPAVQKYLLGNGAILSIRTATGKTSVKGGTVTGKWIFRETLRAKK